MSRPRPVAGIPDQGKWMPTNLPIESVVRVLQATPEQWAAVQVLFAGIGGAGGAGLLMVVAPAAAGRPMAEDRTEMAEDRGVGPTSADVKELVSGIHRDIAAMRRDVGELRRAGGRVSAVDPATDDEARRLFALLKALESEGDYRKAPVTRVFQLYCLEGLKREEVAKKCRCVPALVTLRLQAIEARLGRKASELRQLSGHFERIADSLTDDRARHIHRKSAMDGPEDDEDE